MVHLEGHRQLNPRTILNYRSRLRQPFRLAFNIDFEAEAFSLLAKHRFRTNPPKKRKIPQWSVDNVLAVFSIEEFHLRTASPVNILIKALLLTALASGNRVSKLATTSRLGVSLQTRKRYFRLLVLQDSSSRTNQSRILFLQKISVPP